jgi:Iodothyronine deiodinase.
MESNDKAGIAIAQPKTDAERSQVAHRCQGVLEMSMPVLVDSIDDKVGRMYSGMPDRFYIVDKNGAIVFKSARGPFGFRVGEMEQALAMTLIEDMPKPTPRKADAPTRPPISSDRKPTTSLPTKN